MIKKKQFNIWLVVLVLAAAGFGAYYYFSQSDSSKNYTAYKDFYNLTEQGKIDSVQIKEDRIVFVQKGSETKEWTKNPHSPVLEEFLLKNDVAVSVEKDTAEIQARVAKLGTHINNFDTYMAKLGSSLGTTVNHYNTAYKTLAQIDKDVVKITSKGDTKIEVKQIDAPQVEA